MVCVRCPAGGCPKFGSSESRLRIVESQKDVPEVPSWSEGHLCHKARSTRHLLEPRQVNAQRSRHSPTHPQTNNKVQIMGLAHFLECESLAKEKGCSDLQRLVQFVSISANSMAEIRDDVGANLLCLLACWFHVATDSVDVFAVCLG